MKHLTFLFFLFCSINHLSAQSKSTKNTISEDTTKIIHRDSPVRSLSSAEYAAYQNGDKMDMVRVAELNNYPAPGQVMALEKELKLSVIQRVNLKAAIEALDFKAKEMGRFIIQHEKKLNDLFSSGKVDEGSLIYYCNQIGLYQGELRNAHLQAHLKAVRILTPDQLKKFTRLKGDKTKAE